MRAKQAYRNRASVEVAVLDALVDRHEEGMTVFELRSHTDVDIDGIEEALAGLKSAGLIEVEKEAGTTRIFPDQRVVPDPSEEPEERSWLERLLERLPF